MELGKRIMSGHNYEYRREDSQLGCSKKQRTYELFNGGHLPPGWWDLPVHPDYTKIIDRIILPCKLLLGETFNNYNYTLPDGRILGLVIDLTPHGNNKGLDLKEIKHVKIPCDSVPSNESVNLFVHEIRMFVVQNQNYNKYVLVHCPHGYNRIGYMIVHYLMRTRLITVTRAIQTFADARPPGINKSEYINSLYTFYHEIKPETLIPKPEWQRKAEFISNNNNSNGSSSPENLKQPPMKDNDVIGDSIPSDQEYALRNLCYELLKLPRGESQKLQFPGSNPVPLNKENIELLKQRCYYASWKPEGTRYMMLIAMDGCYLVDSKFNFRRVQMRFPSSVVNKSHHLTLLDGEMVIDTVKKTGEHVRRYLVGDIMAINSISLVERKFHERWDIIDKDVIRPRRNSRNPGYRFDLEPFRVRRKNYWCLSSVPKLLKEFIPSLSHEADGLIFQGWNDPYVPYTNKWALKWKNGEKESVCFLYEVVDEEDHLLYVHDKGEKKFMAANRIVFEKDCNPSEYLGKIIECYWDDEQKKWICIRTRSDRTTPDEYEKYLKVARRIRDNVNDEMLVNEIGKVQISQPNYAAG